MVEEVRREYVECVARYECEAPSQPVVVWGGSVGDGEDD